MLVKDAIKVVRARGIKVSVKTMLNSMATSYARLVAISLLEREPRLSFNRKSIRFVDCRQRLCEIIIARSEVNSERKINSLVAVITVIVFAEKSQCLLKRINHFEINA